MITREEMEEHRAAFRQRHARALAARPAELALEGWSVIPTDEGAIAQWYWTHEPSQRSVSLDEYGEGCVRDRCGPRGAGWYVSVREHDEHGNPIDGELLGPYALFTEAMTVARAQRRHILADTPRATYADQAELFPEPPASEDRTQLSADQTTSTSTEDTAP